MFHGIHAVGYKIIICIIACTIYIVKEDYSSISSIIEFLPGETQHHITVHINNDKRIERDENFQLYLTAGAGVHLTPFPRTEITIQNDDGK